MFSEELGDSLRELRKKKRLSLRDVEQETGVSGSYLSQVEQEKSHPIADLLRKIAPTYGASLRELMTMAGYLDEPEVSMSDHERIEWAYRAVVSDPDYRFGTSMRAMELNIEIKRFIVEIYEKATGRILM